MLGDFAAHAGKYGEHAIGLMIRRSRVELKETIERSRLIYLPIGAKFNETDKMWRFPNGARLTFAYLERDQDADAYQGHSYTRLYVEEAGTFPSERPILKLMATLRSGAGVPVGIRLTGNPGGPGQQWVKARYIDPCPTGWKVQHRTYENPFGGEPITKDWVYIPSRVTDNKFLAADYVANIQMSGSKQLVKAWLEGDWNIVEGAFFDQWDNQRHVVAPFDIPDTWLRFRSMDWGSASPFSVGWWAVAGDSRDVRGGLNSDVGLRIPRGCLVRYREWYGASAPGKGLKLSNHEVAEGIKAREKYERISYGVLDPSAFSEHGGPSIGEEYNKIISNDKHGPFREADNKRVGPRGAMSGWDQMRQRLQGDMDGNPMIVCFSSCVDSIRTIPVLQHDREKAEDIDTESEDHAADEWRYACMSRPYIKIDSVQKRKWEAKDYRPKHIDTGAGDWMTY